MRFNGILAFLFLIVYFEKTSEAAMPFSGRRTGSAEPAVQTVFGGKGSGPGQFGEEIYLDIDEAGRMYVSDVRNHRIQIFDPDGSLIRTIAPSQGGAFRFERLGELAVGRQGTLFVVDRQAVPALDMDTRRVYVYTPVIHRFAPDGTYQNSFPGNGRKRAGGVCGHVR